MPVFKTAVVSILILLAIFLAGCGRKGPLFMEPDPVKPPAVTSALPEPTQPVPSQTSPNQTEPNK